MYMLLYRLLVYIYTIEHQDLTGGMGELAWFSIHCLVQSSGGFFHFGRWFFDRVK
jgi:hypothetical protein